MKAEDIYNVVHCASTSGKSVKIKYSWLFKIPRELVVKPEYVITEKNNDHIIAGKEKNRKKISLKKIKSVLIV